MKPDKQPTVQSSRPSSPWWRRRWDQLTVPPPSVQGREARQDAQLLAALTLLLIALGLLTAVIIPLLIEPQVTLNKPDFWFTAMALGVLPVVYWLSRTPRYRLGAWLIVLVTSATVFAISLPYEESRGVVLQLYLVVPVLLSSILLTPRETTILIVVQLVGMLAYPALFESIAFDRFWPEFVFVVSVMIMVATQYLTERERQRRRELHRYAEHTHALLTAFPDLLIRSDANGNFHDFEVTEGKTPLRVTDSSRGRTLADVMPPDVAASSLARIRKTLETGEIQTSEFSMIGDQGKLEWLESRSMAYGDNEVLTVIRNVTAREEALQALRRSEASNKALTDAIPDLIFRISGDGTFLDYKPSRMGLLMPGEQFLGQPIQDVLPQLADPTLNAIARALDTGMVQVFEYQLPLDGKIHTYEARISPSGDDDVIAIVRDITEQRDYQATLQEREARYRTLFEESPISLWEEDFSAVRTYLMKLRQQGITDLATYLYQHPDIVSECGRRVKILDVNQAALDLLGIDVKDSLLGTLEPIVDDDWYRLFRRELVAFANGMSRFKTETTHTNAQGKQVHTLLTAVIPPAYHDTWKRVYVSSTDITDRKQAQEALKTSERQLELVLDGAELGLWDWDLTTNRLAFNHWWAGITGHEANELDPHISTWDNMLHPDDRARVWSARHAHQDELTASYECEYRLRSKTGDWVWVLDRGKVVERGDVGKPLRMVGTHVDITNRKHIEETARQQRALAEALGDVGALLSSTLDLDEVLDKILTSIGRVVPHDASSITLVENDTLTIVRSQGYDQYDYTEALHSLRLHVDDVPVVRHMLNTRQPVLVPDTEHDPLWRALDDPIPMRSYIGAPIVWDEHVAGVIGLQGSTPQFFDRSHVNRLRAFADQAAIALRNAQWYDTARRRLTEMEVLHQIMLDITSQLRIDSLLDSLIRNALMLLEADAGGIYLYQPEDDVLEWTFSAGDNIIPAGTRLKRGEGLSGTVWERGEAMTVDDYRAWDNRAVMTAEDRSRAVLAAPVTWQGQLLGVVNVAADANKRTFNKHDIWLLNLFANQAATAIQNARLFNAEFEQRALAESLRATAAAINSTLDLHEILDRVLVAVERVVPYDAANILLVDGDHVYVAHHRGYEQYGAVDYMRDLRVAIERWPSLHHTITKRQSVMVEDTHDTDEWEHTTPSSWVRTLIGAPICSGDRVIGALNLDRAEPHSFTTRDKEHVQAFADQAGIAIQNARLYAEVRRHRDELEQRVLERTLDLSVRNAVAETLSSSIDSDVLLSGVLKVVTRQLNVSYGAVYLLNAARDTMMLMASTLDPAAEPDVLPHTLPPDMDALDRTLTAAGQTPTVVSVPIWQREQVGGAIALLHDQPRIWSDSEHRMLEAIGRQLGVALANARSYASAVQGEARIRTILQSVTDGLLVFDKDDDLLLMNPAAEDMLGFHALISGGVRHAAARLWAWLRDYAEAHPDQQRVEFMLPESPLTIAGDPARLAARCSIAHCGATQQTGKGALWPCWLGPGGVSLDEAAQCRLYQDARLIAVQAQRAAVSDADGDILGTVIVLNDVTHYRELDELKGRFVSTVSHELRTPLSTILLQIGTLLKYYPRFDEAERQSMLEEIQEQAQVLRDLVEDILELSRFDANRSLPQKQWFDIVAAYREVLESMDPAIEEKTLTVDVSRCRGSRYVMGDPNQLQRVIRNLLSNAIKYTPPGGMIKAALYQQDNDLVLSVTDSGIGITREEQTHIFDRFYRTKEASDMASGTGLGLAITQEIVEMHGGQIEIESAPGEGSTFTIKLPLGGFDLWDNP